MGFAVLESAIQYIFSWISYMLADVGKLGKLGALTLSSIPRLSGSVSYGLPSASPPTVSSPRLPSLCRGNMDGLGLTCKT